MEGANVKLASVAANVMGVSGRAILKQLVNGVDDPEELVKFVKGRLRSKIPRL